MAAHLTEEEQIEAIKRWWASNGKFIVAVVLAAVIGWFAWNSWQERQERQAQEASRQYSELVAAVTEADGGNFTEEESANVRRIAEEIVNSQPKTLYGNLAALMLAKLAMDADDLEEAESRLRATADNAANSSIASLAKLRLARVLLAKGNHEDALALLDGNAEDAYRAAFAEMRGDIHVAQDQLEEAHTAYQAALNALSPQQSNRSGLLQLKLENTRVAGAPEAESDAPAQTEAAPAEGDV